MTGEEKTPEINGGSVKRSEYIATAAFALNVLTLVFGAGVYVNQIAVQGRAIEELKAVRANDRRDFDDLKTIVIRIDANVTTLAERAREDRETMGRGK